MTHHIKVVEEQGAYWFDIYNSETNERVSMCDNTWQALDEFCNLVGDFDLLNDFEEALPKVRAGESTMDAELDKIVASDVRSPERSVLETLFANAF